MKKGFLILLVFALPFYTMAQKQDTVATLSGRIDSEKPMLLVVERASGDAPTLGRI